MENHTTCNVPLMRFRECDDDLEAIRLGEICTIGDADHWMPATTANGIPYVMTGDFCGINDIDFRNAKRISEKDYEKLARKIKPESGDILFARYASIGLVRLVNTTERFIASYSCAILKGTGKFNSEYLFFLLQSKGSQQQIKQSINTGPQGNVGIDSLNQLLFLFPKTNEQEKIGAYFRTLNHLIALHQRKHDKLAALKKAMLQKMLPQANSTVPEIRFKDFKDNWTKKILGEISSLITKGTTPLGKWGEGAVSFVKIENIDKFSGEIKVDSKISEEEHTGYLKRSQLKAGDILFSIAGTLGRVAIVREHTLPANTNQAIAIIRLTGGNIGYITTYLKGRAVNDFVTRNPTTGAQPNLSLEQVRNLEILLPHENEQKKISAYFRALDELIVQHATQLQKLQQIKSACLEKMFV